MYYFLVKAAICEINLRGGLQCKTAVLNNVKNVLEPVATLQDTKRLFRFFLKIVHVSAATANS